MLINWFTLVAQIINFLILLWLLNKFLYKPVLKTLDEREARIASIISDAESVKLNAMKELEEYSAKNTSIDNEKNSIIQTSRAAVEQERIKIIDNAKNTAQQLIDKQNDILYNERDNFYKNASDELIAQIVRITEKSITALSDTTLESHLIKKCIDNIKHITDKELTAISNLLQICDNTVRIRTSQPLDSESISQLQESLANVFGPAITIHYEHAPHLLCGIELIIDTYKLSWNAHDYIQKALIGVIGSSATGNEQKTDTTKEFVQ
jgi:F-type H+-transporting ATPase subunit b